MGKLKSDISYLKIFKNFHFLIKIFSFVKNKNRVF